MQYTIYGLKNCDTCRKALRWLVEQGIDTQLHDLREDGLPESLLDEWLEELGAESLVNRRSTSWRELSDAERERIETGDARALLLNCPTLIKRPLLQINGQWVQGFSTQKYETLRAC